MSTLFEMVYEELAEERAYVSGNPRPHAYASEALGCARRITLRMLETEKDFAPGMQLLMSGFIGNHLHTLIQTALERKHEDVVPELKWDNDLVTGRADGVYREGSDLVVLEIKTMNNFAFLRNVKSGEPTREHRVQAELSAITLGAKKVHIVYINRNLSMRDEPMRDWVLDVDEGFAEVEMDRLAGLALMVREGRVADREYLGDIIEDPMSFKWPCGFCPYRIMCIDLGFGEFQADTVREKLGGGPISLPVI